jgi:hypothetical protein
MIKVMRLKHLSFNAEKTYTGWSRQFQGFVNGKTSSVFDQHAKSASIGLIHYLGRNWTEFKIGTSVQLINTPPEAYLSSTARYFDLLHLNRLAIKLLSQEKRPVDTVHINYFRHGI